ncbi:MAG: glycosyltransferase [Candidatus Omnitrophota bacterium]
MKKILINDIGYLIKVPRIAIISKIKIWQKRGFRVTILCPRAGRIFYEKYLADVDFIVVPACMDTRNNFILIGEFLKRNIVALFFLPVIRNRYDVIYSVSAVLDIVLLPWCLKVVDGKVKWSVVFDNIVPLKDPGNKIVRFLAWLFFLISVAVVHKADRIFAISQDLKLFLLENGFREEQVTVTGNAVEVELIKKAVRTGDHTIDALFIGRINETKGIYDMLKILEEIKKIYPSFQLAIMGDGDELTKRDFRKTIKEKGLEANIRFLGYRSGLDKFTVIKSSRCFWFFSVSASESFGIALMEAVCSGVPAFAYDLPPYRTIYRNHEVTIIEKGNYRAATSRILEFFKAGRFENRNGTLLLDRYNWDAIADIEYNSMSSYDIV